MKIQTAHSVVLAAAAVLLLGLLAGFAQAGENYKIDNVHSSLVFRVKHLGLTDVFGRFNEMSGTYVFDREDPAKSSVEIQIQAASIDTRVEKRDNHLRSADFFHVEKYPLITFRSREIKKLEGESYSVSGDLTLLGVSRPLVLTVQHGGSGKDPWGGYRTGFEGTFSIQRSDFGMNFMLGAVADRIDLMVAVEGVRQ